MTHPDIERYIRSKTGSITEGERQQQIADIIRYRTPDLEPADFEPTQYGRGFFLPPGFQAGNVTDIAAPATNQANAMYLGVADTNKALVTILMNVVVGAATITWAEIAIATSLDAVMGAGADLILEGFTDVALTFNTTGNKSTEVAVNIGRGAHVWCVWGSQATTPFTVRGGLGDAISSGRTLFLGATRPSTMANPTSFTLSSSATLAAWMGVSW